METGGFFVSLERYGRALVARNPLPYPWIVIALITLVLCISFLSKSLVSVNSVEEAVRQAASAGDYPLAKKLYAPSNDQVLGATSELEALVYPEERVEQRISALEETLETYPSNREIYLQLAGLYGQLDKQEQESYYREQARILDPNGN